MPTAYILGECHGESEETLVVHLIYREAYVQEASGAFSIEQIGVLLGSQDVAACAGQLNGQLQWQGRLALFPLCLACNVCPGTSA